MKKIITILLSCILLIAFYVDVSAVDSNQFSLNIKDGRFVDNPDAQHLIDEFFLLRNQVLLSQKSLVSILGTLNSITSNKTLCEKEIKRSFAKENLNQYHGIMVAV